MGQPPCLADVKGPIESHALDADTLRAMKNARERERMYNDFIDFVR